MSEIDDKRLERIVSVAARQLGADLPWPDACVVILVGVGKHDRMSTNLPPTEVIDMLERFADNIRSGLRPATVEPWRAVKS